MLHAISRAGNSEVVLSCKELHCAFLRRLQAHTAPFSVPVVSSDYHRAPQRLPWASARFQQGACAMLKTSSMLPFHQAFTVPGVTGLVGSARPCPTDSSSTDY
jgi:hypothetical protein